MTQPSLPRRTVLSAAAATAALPLAASAAAATTRGTTRRFDQANVIPVSPSDTMEELRAKAAHVVPTPRQKSWQELELTAFVHFGVNTFTGREWGTGTENPDVFAPSAFDPQQWVRALHDAGFRILILTVKHHDGFVLYPSRYTDHDVASSSWRGGKGNVLADVAAAVHDAGMGLGVYLSPADLHEIEAPDGRYGNNSPWRKSTVPTLVEGDDRADEVASGELPTFEFVADDYNRYFENQIYEILTEYGPVREFWFDGANPKPGVEERYAYGDWFRLIRELSPRTVIAIGGPDVRWVGNENGLARESEWSPIPMVGDPRGLRRDMVAEETDSNVGGDSLLPRADYLAWYPAEVDVSIRPGWFYHADEDDEVKSLAELREIYNKSVGRNSVLLLNVPPNREGRFAEADVRRLAEFGDWVRDFNADDAIHGAKVTDTAPGSGRGKYAAGHVVDGDPDTCWMPSPQETTGTLRLELPEPRTFDTVALAEDLTIGQRIEDFAVDAWIQDGWTEIGTGTTVGYQRLLPVGQVTTAKVRVRIRSARATPTLTRVGLLDDPL